MGGTGESVEVWGHPDSTGPAHLFCGALFPSPRHPPRVIQWATSHVLEAQNRQKLPRGRGTDKKWRDCLISPRALVCHCTGRRVSLQLGAGFDSSMFYSVWFVGS